MKRVLRALSALALAGALALPTAPTFAMAVAPGPEFGAHVANMAAEEQHPLLHGGRHFGECISSLATGEPCPHEMGM